MRGVMSENVTAMLENIEKGQNLEQSSSSLADQARQFNSMSRRARRALWWQQCKMRLIIGSCVGASLLILVLIIAGQAGAFDNNQEPSL